jgi:hypothetical protein
VSKYRQLWGAQRREAVLRDAHTRDVPKAARRRPRRTVPPMSDPIATLGHPARPRKRSTTTRQETSR